VAPNTYFSEDWHDRNVMIRIANEAALEAVC
jgi:hypothetical protein